MPSPHHSAIHPPVVQPLQSYAIPVPAALFPCSETFSQLLTLHHSLPHRIFSYILLLHHPLSHPAPCWLSSTPVPTTLHCHIFSTVLLTRPEVGREKKKKNLFSPVSLSSPVQGLSLCSGGESKCLPHSLPHEEVLLGMVWSYHGGKKGLMGEAEDCYWTQ